MRVAHAALPFLVDGYPVFGFAVPPRPCAGPNVPGPLKPANIGLLLQAGPYAARAKAVAQAGIDLCYEGVLPSGVYRNMVPPELCDEVDRQLRREIAAGYIAPLHEDVVAAVPELLDVANAVLRAVVEPTKIRRLHDHSAWHYDAAGEWQRGGVNARVNLAALGQCPLGTVTDMGKDVYRLRATWGVDPVGMVVDFKGAFRQLPVRAVDVPSQLLRWRGVLAWDCRASMGHRSAAHAMAQLSCAICDAANVAGAGLLRAYQYIDDHLVLMHPAVMAVMAPWYLQLIGAVGMTVAPSKLQVPGPQFHWLGFGTCLRRQVHWVPPAKLAELLLLLQEATAWPAPGPLQGARAAAARRLLGKLQHVAHVFQPGRPLLRATYTAVDAETMSVVAAGDLRWWASVLPRLDRVCAMRRPHTAADMRVTTDASLHGFGFVVRPGEAVVQVDAGYWAPWPPALRVMLRTGDMPWLEAIGFLCALLHMLGDPLWSRRIRHGMLVWEGDCTGALHALLRGASRNPGLHAVVRAVFAQFLVCDIQLHTVHVPSERNVADFLSRLPGPAHLLPAPPARRWRRIARTSASPGTPWLLSKLGSYRRHTAGVGQF